MPRVWRFTPHDESQIRALCAELRVAPLTAQVLISRGFSAGAQAREFLDARLAALHEPNLLPGVPQAADAIVARARSRAMRPVGRHRPVTGPMATSSTTTPSSRRSAGPGTNVSDTSMPTTSVERVATGTSTS